MYDDDMGDLCDHVKIHDNHESRKFKSEEKNNKIGFPKSVLNTEVPDGVYNHIFTIIFSKCDFISV